MSTHPSGDRPVTVADLQAATARGERFAMLTAYDALTASMLDDAGIPVVLVGDSLGMVVLGYDSTIPVTLEDMLHHTRAVRTRSSSRVAGPSPTSSSAPPPPGSR